MKTRRVYALPFAFALGLLAALPASAVDVRDTRMLSQPALSADHIAFAYAHDLWIADRDGANARRLTSHPGNEFGPAFSPDGETVAFSAEYDGNIDVFVVPADGGVPTRLTWHPGSDLVRGFSADGSAVLFNSQRTVHTNRYLQLFQVPVGGGFPERIPVPNAFYASLSPDGARLAYNPLTPAFQQWKNYRGGTHSRIWIADLDDLEVEEIPQPPDRPNDVQPMWIGDVVYFLSDRDGEFNLYRYDPATQAVERLTEHDDFPILAASAGDGKILYEQAGYLHLFDPATGAAQRLRVGVAADLIETRPRYASDDDFIRSGDISPSGARVVFDYRGEILTLPAEKGDPRNLTQTTGVHERYPVWSPDGVSIAYFSDAGGEYRLHVAPQDGRGEVKGYALDGAGFYERPLWSPDGEKIAYRDNSRTLYWIDLATGEQTRVAAETYYSPFNTLNYSWSPDSEWLAYTLQSESYLQTVHLYSLADDRSTALTGGLADAAEPVFDKSGKYLWFFASTNAGPVRQWFAQSRADMDSTHNLYLAVLDKTEPSPIAKESDEEKPDDEEAADEEGNDEGDDEGDEKSGDKKGRGKKGKKADDEAEMAGEKQRITIDLEGLDQRIVALPVPAAQLRSLAAGGDGEVYYLSSPPEADGPPSLKRFQLESREEESLLDGVFGFAVSEDRKKLLVRTPDAYLVADAGGKIDPSEGRIDTAAVQVRIDPRAEWAQILREVWRINRDYFYDPGMHGADWPAMWERYAAFLPHLATRSDLTRVIRWLGSELAVGHHYTFGGDQLADVESIPGGLLGADYEIDSRRYRFAEVYGGLNWNPDLRAPLTEPGVGVEAGDYLLAVNGVELTADENLFARFERTAGKIVELTVGPSADGAGSRTVEVVPIESEGALRNRAWVEGNLAKVDAATGGRVAYVYVPNTAGAGHTYFKRYFFPQSHKEAIIVDERYNGGGSVADYYIDHLRRPYISHWATRYGKDIKTPKASIDGPKAMLIDETAGSGGDLLPWMFRKLGLGPLIGKRTWGGLVGILGFPVLLDGGFVTAPNLAIWTEDGFIVENEGVPPDIEVEQWPARVEAGHDPQLERAIEWILEELEKNPPPTYERPPFPVRARQPGD